MATLVRIGAQNTEYFSTKISQQRYIHRKSKQRHICMSNRVGAYVRVLKAALKLIRDEGLKASANAGCRTVQRGRNEMVYVMKSWGKIQTFQLLLLSLHNQYTTILLSTLCLVLYILFVKIQCQKFLLTSYESN